VGQLEASAENVQEIHRELAAARAVQIKLLPAKPPTIDGYEVSAFYESCSELGGDMFHFLPAGDGRMGFLIGDVSGHGVGAAMIMAGAMKSFVVRAKDQPSPTSVVVSVCRDLAPDIPPGRFVSAFYGVLEGITGRFCYVRAGHNPPYLYDAQSRKVTELSATGLALGICRPEQFEPRLKEDTVTLKPGGILVLYTDGIVEAQNTEKVLFSEEKLQQIIQENASRSSRRIAEAIITATRQHTGDNPMEDDVTLVVIKRVAE
jgi:sigma-B regulation protein RsbU (phosphoserine phosphatase)